MPGFKPTYFVWATSVEVEGNIFYPTSYLLLRLIFLLRLMMEFLSFKGAWDIHTRLKNHLIYNNLITPSAHHELVQTNVGAKTVAIPCAGYDGLILDNLN